MFIFIFSVFFSFTNGAGHCHAGFDSHDHVQTESQDHCHTAEHKDDHSENNKGEESHNQGSCCDLVCCHISLTLQESDVFMAQERVIPIKKPVFYSNLTIKNFSKKLFRPPIV